MCVKGKLDALYGGPSFLFAERMTLAPKKVIPLPPPGRKPHGPEAELAFQFEKSDGVLKGSGLLLNFVIF